MRSGPENLMRACWDGLRNSDALLMQECSTEVILQGAVVTLGVRVAMASQKAGPIRLAMLRLQGGVSTATTGADPPAVVEALAAALHVVPAPEVVHKASVRSPVGGAQALRARLARPLGRHVGLHIANGLVIHARILLGHLRLGIHLLLRLQLVPLPHILRIRLLRLLFGLLRLGLRLFLRLHLGLLLRLDRSGLLRHDIFLLPGQGLPGGLRLRLLLRLLFSLLSPSPPPLSAPAPWPTSLPRSQRPSSP